MSELKVTQGEGSHQSEILASGVTRVDVPKCAYTFTYGGQSKTVRVWLERPPRRPDGNYFLPLPEGTLFPGDSAFHDIGGANVFVELTALARPQGYVGPDAWLFSYQVTRPLASPSAVAA